MAKQAESVESTKLEVADGEAEQVETSTAVVKKQKPIAKSELPRKTLEECLVVAKIMNEQYAGLSASTDEIALAMGSSSKTASTKYLIWGAQGYNLITREGDKYTLSETGRKIVAPNDEEEASSAKKKAITVPTILSRFYSEFDGKQLPEDSFFSNVLKNQYNIPQERTNEAKKIILQNADFASILMHHINGKMTIRLEGYTQQEQHTPSESANTDNDSVAVENLASDVPSGIAQSIEGTCFYITPIGDEGSEPRKHSDMFLKYLVEPAFKEFGIRVIRADKIEKTGLITQQIFTQIVSSKFCVADLSFRNPNAFYELGIRHMTKLPTIQIIRKNDKIPFDVAQGRTIVVDTSDIYTITDRLESARRELIEHIKYYTEGGEKTSFDDNPVAVYLPSLQVKLPKVED